MKNKRTVSDSKSDGLSRRRFLGAGCAACAGMAGAITPGLSKAAGSGGKLRIRVVYALQTLKQDRPDWPNLGFDFAPVIEKYNAALESAFPEIEFLTATANGPTQAEKILAGDLLANIDGYIVIQLNNWMLVIQTIAAAMKPVLFVDFKYGGTGGFLVFSAGAIRSKAGNLGFISSSNLDDLIAAVGCFETVKKSGRAWQFADLVEKTRIQRTPAPGDLACASDPVDTISPDECIRKLKASKILAVGYPGVSLFALPQVPIKMISFSELSAASKAADQTKAREIAERWQADAARVEGVSPETLTSSAAMYLGMNQLLEKHKANAITVNCLVGFYSGGIQAYPCLGFHELLNQGLVGACECDVRSTATMLAITALTRGRPGYISDPVLDTAHRQIIYAHCVASNRPFGPEGPANPFEILTHSEDRKGASVRSLLPEGYMTTTLEIAPERRQILIHRAKAVGNDPDDRACRTKLVAEPLGDFEKLFTHWDRWGWHRVTVYGDLQDQVAELARALHYQVVQEA